MKTRSLKKLLFTLAAFGVFATSYAASGTWYVATTGNNANSGDMANPFLTIQHAINQASNGDSIFVSNGTYTITATLDVNKGVVIHGESMAGVILDASGMTPITNRVIETDADNVTLRNLTIKPITDPDANNGNNIGFTMKVGSNSGTTVNNNIVLHNISIDGAAERTPFDIHGVTGIQILNLSASGTTRGNGISFSGCTDVYLNGFTGTSNAWGSIAIYASRYVPSGGRGSDDVTIVGSSLSIDGNVFSQDDFGTPDLFNTDITVTGWDYTIFNDDFRTGGDGPEYTFFAETKDDAAAIGEALNLGNSGNTASAIKRISNGQWYVTNLNTELSIQAAIDEATAGDVINVDAGTFEEGLNIGKSITLLGANESISPNTGSRGTESIIKPQGGSGAPDAITGSANGVTVVVRGFTFDLEDTRYSSGNSKRYMTQTSKTGTWCGERSYVHFREHRIDFQLVG